MRKLLFALSLMVIMTLSCSKQDEVKKGSKIALLRLPVVENPVLIDGMLTFRDTTHFEDYINYLQKAIAVSSKETDSMTQDEILLSIEQSLNFTSLREIAYQKFERLNDIGWEKVEDVPEIDFVKGMTLRSVLNEYRDVRIADRIMHFVSPEFSVVLSATDRGLLSELHKLPNNPSLFDLQNLKIASFSGDLEISTLSVPSAGITSNRTTNVAGYQYTPGLIIFPDPCNNPNKVKLYGTTVVHLMPNGATDDKEICQTTFELNWGDGSPIETVESLPISSGGHLNNVFHTYPQPGNYTLSVRYRVNAPRPSNWATASPVTVGVNNGCNYGTESNHMNAGNVTTDGTEKSTNCDAYITFYTGVFGKKFHKIGASLAVFHHVGNRVKKFKAQRVECKYICEKQFTCGTYFHSEDGISRANTCSVEIEVDNSKWCGWASIHSEFRFFNANVPYLYIYDTSPCH